MQSKVSDVDTACQPQILLFNGGQSGVKSVMFAARHAKGLLAVGIYQ